MGILDALTDTNGSQAVGSLRQTSQTSLSLSGQTDPSTLAFETEYQAPEAVGDITVHEVCTVSTPDGPFSFGTDVDVGVEYSAAAGNFEGVSMPDLQAAPNQQYMAVDSTSTTNSYHDANGYADPTTVKNLQALHSQYLACTTRPAGSPIQVLHVTAISLPKGGLFDVTPDDWAGYSSWKVHTKLTTGKTPVHRRHRFGYEVDVGVNDANGAILSSANQSCFEQAYEAAQFVANVAEENPAKNKKANHWHLDDGPLQKRGTGE